MNGSSFDNKLGKLEGRLDGIDRRIDGIERRTEDKLRIIEDKQDQIFKNIQNITELISSVKASWKTILYICTGLTTALSLIFWFFSAFYQ